MKAKQSRQSDTGHGLFSSLPQQSEARLGLLQNLPLLEILTMISGLLGMIAFEFLGATRNLPPTLLTYSMSHPKSTLWKFLVVLFAASLAGVVPHADAKADHAPEDEMIERAEVIAIVDISRVEKTETKSQPFNYRQIAHATVHQTLKGKLPKEIKLYGGESFECAQVHFTPGRSLVFLRHAGEFLVGCNWHLSVRPIKDTEVEWYVPGERHNLSWQSLDTVLVRIQNPPAKPKTK